MKFHWLAVALGTTIAVSVTCAADPQTQSPLSSAAVNTKAVTNAKGTALDVLAEGQAAFNAHEYEKAFELWLKLAQQGHVEAQVFVGLAYKNGWGVSRDPARASMWFQMAAEGGNPSAQLFIGLHYLSSDNPELVPVGVDWLVQAARNGESSARQFLLKAKQRQWFPVPDNFDVSTLDIKTKITQVTSSNIDQVFSGSSPSTTDAPITPP